VTDFHARRAFLKAAMAAGAAWAAADLFESKTPLPSLVNKPPRTSLPRPGH
jgi:hypothetical protein